MEEVGPGVYIQDMHGAREPLSEPVDCLGPQRPRQNSRTSAVTKRTADPAPEDLRAVRQQTPEDRAMQAAAHRTASRERTQPLSSSHQQLLQDTIDSVCATTSQEDTTEVEEEEDGEEEKEEGEDEEEECEDLQQPTLQHKVVAERWASRGTHSSLKAGPQQVDMPTMIYNVACNLHPSQQKRGYDYMISMQLGLSGDDTVPVHRSGGRCSYFMENKEAFDQLSERVRRVAKAALLSGNVFFTNDEAKALMQKDRLVNELVNNLVIRGTMDTAEAWAHFDRAWSQQGSHSAKKKNSDNPFDRPGLAKQWDKALSTELSEKQKRGYLKLAQCLDSVLQLPPPERNSRCDQVSAKNALQALTRPDLWLDQYDRGRLRLPFGHYIIKEVVHAMWGTTDITLQQFACTMTKVLNKLRAYARNWIPAFDDYDYNEYQTHVVAFRRLEEGTSHTTQMLHVMNDLLGKKRGADQGQSWVEPLPQESHMLLFTIKDLGRMVGLQGRHAAAATSSGTAHAGKSQGRVGETKAQDVSTIARGPPAPQLRSHKHALDTNSDPVHAGYASAKAGYEPDLVVYAPTIAGYAPYPAGFTPASAGYGHESGGYASPLQGHSPPSNAYQTYQTCQLLMSTSTRQTDTQDAPRSSRRLAAAARGATSDGSEDQAEHVAGSGNTQAQCKVINKTGGRGRGNGIRGRGRGKGKR